MKAWKNVQKDANHTNIMFHTSFLSDIKIDNELT